MIFIEKARRFAVRGMAILLALGMLMGVVGCGDKPTSSDATSSTAKVSYKTVDLQKRNIKIYQYGFRKSTATATEDGRRFMNRIAELEKAFNCTIELTEDDNYTAVWNSTLAGQPSHDIMSVAAPHLFAQPATNGCFVDLNQYTDAFNWSDEKWNTQLQDIFRLNGKQYSCSVGYEGVGSMQGNLVMYFNKRLVKEAGYNPDDLYTWQKDGTWNWSKFEEIATKIAALSTSGNQIWGAVNNDYQLYNNLCVSNGANWIVKDDTGVHFNADDSRCMTAFGFMQKLVKNNIMPAATTFNDYKQFLEGKVGFIPEYIERLQHKDGYGGMQDDFGLVMFPKADNAKTYQSINDWYSGWAILTGVKEPEKIALLVNALTETMYPDETDLANTVSSAQMSWVRDEGSLDVFGMVKNNTILSGKGLASPVDTEWTAQIGKVLNGEKTISQAIQEVKSSYTDTLDSLWEVIEIESQG
jgi:ABC-type glycerol-3-phosphate transport system substrate-binding protein